MTRRSQVTGFLLLVCGAVLFVAGGAWIAHSNSLRYLDFKALYYGTRCALSGCDPYNPVQLDGFFLVNGGAQHGDSPAIRNVVTRFVNFPTALLLCMPFAVLPWTLAHILWTVLTCTVYSLACFLIWTSCTTRAPILSAALISLLLGTSQTIFAGGNAVGLVVGLTCIAAWCFIRGRCGSAGAFCLALALLLKPHDAGVVWLFFVIAGGVWRKRALQTLAFAAVAASAALVWAGHFAPNWPREQRDNLVAISTHGGMNSPSPGASVDRSAGMLVNLQSVLAVVDDTPAFYNCTTYALCAALLLLWACRCSRVQWTENEAWFALAAVVPIGLLVVYHKPYDVKLLLLAIPACILLWSEKNLRGQFACLLTLGAVFCTADIPLAVYVALTDAANPDLHTLAGKLLAIVVLRPVSLILVALVTFYLNNFLHTRSSA